MEITLLYAYMPQGLLENLWGSLLFCCVAAFNLAPPHPPGRRNALKERGNINHKWTSKLCHVWRLFKRLASSERLRWYIWNLKGSGRKLLKPCFVDCRVSNLRVALWSRYHYIQHWVQTLRFLLGVYHSLIPTINTINKEIDWRASLPQSAPCRKIP